MYLTGLRSILRGKSLGFILIRWRSNEPSCNLNIMPSFLVALVEWSYWLPLAFYPKILGGGAELQIVLCNSSGGDTQTLPAVIEFVWNFCTHRRGGCQNITLASLHPVTPRAHFVKLSEHLILTGKVVCSSFRHHRDLGKNSFAESVAWEVLWFLQI